MEVLYKGHQRQIAERSGCDLRPFFKQGNESLQRLLRLFGRGGQQGVVQLDSNHDQHNFCKGSRVVEMDFTILDALLDDFRQIRL